MTEVQTPVQTPEQITANIDAAFLDKDVPVVGTPDPIVTDPVAAVPPVTPIVPIPSTLKHGDIWEGLKTKGAVIPKEFSEGKFGENVSEFDALVQTIINNTTMPGEGDPFIEGYLQTPAEQRAEFVKNYNASTQIVSLPTDDVLKWQYSNVKDDKGERVYKDEEITEYLEKTSKLQKDREANQIRTQLQEQQTKAQAGPTYTQEQIDAALKTANDDIMARVTPILAAEDALTEVHGVPYTPEMKADFKQTFTMLNTINPKTGDPYYNAFLKDDNNFRDVVRAYSLMKDNKLKSYLSNFKEDFKTDVLDKLDLNPKSKGGAGSFAVATMPEP